MNTSPSSASALLPRYLVALLIGAGAAQAQPANNAVAGPTNQVAVIRPDPLAMEMQAAVLHKQDLQEVQRILKAGFDINAPIGCGTFNSVDGAVAVGNVKILKYLLTQGAEPKGWALYQAAWGKKPEVSYQLTDALLKAGANAGYRETYPSNWVTGDTRLPATNRFDSPLHVACYLNNEAVVRLLLKQASVDLDGLNIDGYTPS